MTSPDENPPIAEPTRPKRPSRSPRKREDAPLTQEDFSAQMQQLTAKAKAAGLSPIQTMLQSYAKQGMRMVEGMMGALENDNKPQGKKRK